jgi:hypothetical protein
VITVWDRRSLKTDPITGREVPDEAQRVPLLAYLNPRPADWPAADFIVGNPPFLGNKRMRADLGDGYAETLRAAYPAVPESADFVLYWWHKAATLVRAGQTRRFGFITTNSLRQTSARRVVQRHLTGSADFQSAVSPTFSRQALPGSAAAPASERSPAESPAKRQTESLRYELPPLSLVFAIPDHPWVDTADGAAVRIAMTVGVAGEHPGEFLQVTAEQLQEDGSEKVTFTSRRGKISADLTIGANVSTAVPLKSNEGVCFQGMNLVGEGFRVTPEEATKLGHTAAGPIAVIRHYQKGRELVQGGSSGLIIDAWGLTAEELREQWPTAYQHLLVHVKPERDQNNRASRKRNWWLFGEPVGKLRKAVAGLHRFIATVETSKFKPFVLLKPDVVPDHKLYAITLDDAFFLGVLSSRIHQVWALAAGGTLEDRPTWTNTTCFLPFPFPLCGEPERARIRALAEELDAHRKRVQAQHPGLTLTGMYNVLEKLRAHSARPAALPHPHPHPLGEGTAVTRVGQPGASGASPARSTLLPLPAGEGRGEGERAAPPAAPAFALTPKEKLIHDQGLVSVLQQLHADLDAAVFAAYGWPATLTDAEILERLVALNAARAEEEQRGIIHWLRPEYQNPSPKVQGALDLPAKPAPPKRLKSAIGNRQSAIPQLPWPKSLPERVRAVETALHATPGPVTPKALAATFHRAQPEAIAEILETLVTLGRARQQGGQFMR